MLPCYGEISDIQTVDYYDATPHLHLFVCLVLNDASTLVGH